MMYIIETADHTKVSEHKNLSAVRRPDSGWSQNVKVDADIINEVPNPNYVGGYSRQMLESALTMLEGQVDIDNAPQVEAILAQLDEPRSLIERNKYFIRKVEEPIVGEGPRNLGWGPIEYIDGQWQRENRIGPALPPAPDPVLGDEDYNHADLRRRDLITAYGSEAELYGQQFDAILDWAVSVRFQKSKIDLAIDAMTEINHPARDALKAALTPVFDLPADLDAAITPWLKAKSDYKKPE